MSARVRHRLTRLNVLLLAGLLGSLVMACAPASTPAPTAAKPAESAAAPASKPAEAAKPAAATAAPAAPAAAPAAQPKAAASQPLREIQFGLVSNILYSPIYLAVEKGLFVKHGLDLKLRQFDSGASVTKGLQSGEIELGVAAVQTYITAKNQDIPFKGFYLLVSDATILGVDQNLSLMSHPNSGITKIEDLAGKKVAAAAGTNQDLYLKEVLAKHNVPVDKVEIVNIPIPTTHTALVSGNVDAASLQEPYGELAMHLLPGTRLLVRGGEFVTQRIMVTAPEEWLAKNPELAERFAVAYAEAAHYARNNLDEAGDAAARILSGVPPEVARKAVRHPPFDPRYSNLVDRSWDSENEVLLSQKKIKRAIPISEGFNPALAEKVSREYPQFFSDLKPIPN